MVLLAYTLLCLIWGSTWIAIKLGLADTPPLFAAAMRFFLATLILYSIVKIRRERLPANLGEFLRLGMPGFFMFGLSYALIYFSELYISSALTAVLFASFPLFVGLMSHWMFREERLDLIAWGGLILGLAGIVVISYDSFQTSADLFKGTLLALAGSFAAAYGMLRHKKNSVDRPIFVATMVQMTVGGIPLLITALIFENYTALTFSKSMLGSILYLALFGTVVAFILYFWLLRKISAVNAALMAFITPLVAIFIGVLFFEESLTTLIVIGTVMILSGILLTNRRYLAKRRRVPV